MFIARKTFGWGKSFDRISLSQIEDGTGMARSTVVAACKSLTDHGILETRPAEGRTPAAYRLNLAAEIGPEVPQITPQEAPDCTDNPTSDCTDFPTSRKIKLVGLSALTVPIIGTTRNTTQETEEKTPPCHKNDMVSPGGKRERFVPPTIEEVRASFKSHGRLDLADEWFGYWDSVNWWRKRGVRMQKWRSAVSGWVSQKKEDSSRLMPARASPPSLVFDDEKRIFVPAP